MQEEILRQRMTSTCQGIQLLYRSRKVGIEQHRKEKQRLEDEWDNEIETARKNAKEPGEPANVRRMQTANLKALEEQKAHIRRKENELKDLENDDQFNECGILTGLIETVDKQVSRSFF